MDPEIVEKLIFCHQEESKRLMHDGGHGAQEEVG
jgi:hypothetical protein